jgi:hypothetical protein
MTSKRIRHAQRWRGRQYTAAINAALAANGYECRVRIRPLRNVARDSFAKLLVRVAHRFTLPRDDPKWNQFARYVNGRLTAPRGGLEIANGTVECIRCLNDVVMTEDPQEWQRRRDGRWKVTGYWCSTATCCGLLYAEGFEGTSVYEMPRTA